MDMFLKLDGIKGESLDGGKPSHKGDIDVLAWSWGLSNSGTAQVGGGAGGGRVSVQDLSLTKYVDVASPFLTLAVCDGHHISSAVLTVRKFSGKLPVDYVAYKLEEVLVTSLSTGGSGGEDRLTENISLNFAKVTWSYVPVDQNGIPQTAITRGWDVAQNQKA
jgi:type VI secretion system secreted protein Hcp